MKRSFLFLHIAVLLAGITGPIGKLITLNEGLLVWYRLLLTCITLWLLVFLRRKPVRLKTADIFRVTGAGILATLHWITFYGSIKYSNVSVGLVCFSSAGFFTALVEPLILRVRINVRELLLGLLVIAGIYLIFHFDPHYKIGIIIGLISALLCSIWTVVNGRLLKRIAVDVLTTYELTGGFLFLSFLLPLYLHFTPGKQYFPTTTDWLWLLVLAWLCTVVAFEFSMRALQKISAFTVNLTYNLEPVYGILIAVVFMNESRLLDTGFYLGLGCILLAIMLQMFMNRRRQNEIRI